MKRRKKCTMCLKIDFHCLLDYKSKDEDDDKKRQVVAFGYFDNPVTLKRNFLTIQLKSIKEIFDNP